MESSASEAQVWHLQGGGQQTQGNRHLREPLQQRLRQLLSACSCRRQSRLTPPSMPCHEAKEHKSLEPALQSTSEALEPEERLCRYCFDGDIAGELISPCSCMGGQKYVHLTCLRMWQRAVLVSQPTHPDLQGSDVRQRICNVCKAEFTCPPPTRTELMASMTGPEIAALIDEGCLIGSAEDFSNDLDAQMAGFPDSVRERVVCRNWIRGIFLIVKVVQDRQRDAVLLRVDSDEELRSLIAQLGEDAQTLHLRGRKFTIVNRGPLRSVATDATPEERREAMDALSTPVSLRLRPEPVADCGEDGVIAVNLTRTLYLASVRSPWKQCWLSTIANVKERVFASADATPPFEITHFLGGPCEEEQVAACLILTAGCCMLLQEEDCLRRAFVVANSMALGESPPDEGRAPAGATWLRECPLPRHLDADDDDEDAPAGQNQVDEPVAKRHKQETNMGSTISNASTVIEGPSSENVSPRHDVRLLVMWGYAGWSRCQLMGEIARGSWGLCRASPEDVLQEGPATLWAAAYPRLVFAPKNEMSESYGGEVPEEEERRRQLRHMAIFHEILHGRLGLTHTIPSQRMEARPNDDSEEPDPDNFADIDDVDDETLERIRAEVDGYDEESSEDAIEDEDEEDEDDDDEHEDEDEDSGVFD